MAGMSTGRLRELLEEATTGPWRVDDETGEIYGTNGKQVVYPLDGGTEVWMEWATDADYILAAGAPELAEEVIRLREENARLQELERLCKTSEEFFAGLDKEQQ